MIRYTVPMIRVGQSSDSGSGGELLLLYVSI